MANVRWKDKSRLTLAKDDRIPGTDVSNLNTDGYLTPSDIAAHAFVPHPVTGRYRAPPVTALGSVTMTANTMYMIPIFLPKMTITEAAFYVTTLASGATVRLGLYNMDANGEPTTLISDMGTVSVASTGKKTITSLSVNVETGWYFQAMSSDGAPVTRGNTTNNVPTTLGFDFDASVHGVATLSRAFTHGAFPADETSETYTGAPATTLIPIFGVK